MSRKHRLLNAALDLAATLPNAPTAGCPATGVLLATLALESADELQQPAAALALLRELRAVQPLRPSLQEHVATRLDETLHLLSELGNSLAARAEQRRHSR